MSQSRRQQTGLACEDCRRRKARCDRVRPSCGSCTESGTSCCYVDKRPQRGPRKGQMTRLKNLVADLEQQLRERTRQQQTDHGLSSPENLQKHDAIPDPFWLPEQDSTIGEAVSIPLSIDMENCNLSSTGYENHSLGTSSLGTASLSNVLLDESPFISSMLSGADMSFLTTLDGCDNNMMSDQNFISDWLNGEAILSPSVTPPGSQQFLDFEAMPSDGGPALSELMEADLDELYFERVHPISSNIHRRNYFAWARQERRSASQVALQYAMRAVAAAMSAQYQPISGMLCANSRRVLEKMDTNGGNGDCGDNCIQQIQAWLLVAYWELLCNQEHQAMLTAGRAIRMVQLARLHEVDSWNMPFMSEGAEMNSFHSSPLSDEKSFAKAEEQRRTFWSAYCFDRLCLMHSECPPSLQDESIRTRLPAPEANFQNTQPIQMDFLSEAIAHNGHTTLPPFARCVVLHSLFSRCISHQSFAMSEAAFNGSDSRKVWSKYVWLALAVEKIRGQLVQNLPGDIDIVNDPMATFANALGACAAINVYQSMAQTATWTVADHEETVPQYKEQAVQAAGELVRVIELMPRYISCFKAHAFLPTLIYRGALFLTALSRSSSPAGTNAYSNNLDGELGILLGALRDLQQVNNLSRNLLCKLEHQEIKDAMSKCKDRW